MRQALFWLNSLCPGTLPVAVRQLTRSHAHHLLVAVGEYGGGEQERYHHYYPWYSDSISIAAASRSAHGASAYSVRPMAARVARAGELLRAAPYHYYYYYNYCEYDCDFDYDYDCCYYYHVQESFYARLRAFEVAAPTARVHQCTAEEAPWVNYFR